MDIFFFHLLDVIKKNFDVEKRFLDSFKILTDTLEQKNVFFNFWMIVIILIKVVSPETFFFVHIFTFHIAARLLSNFLPQTICFKKDVCELLPIKKHCLADFLPPTVIYKKKKKKLPFSFTNSWTSCLVLNFGKSTWTDALIPVPRLVEQQER